MRFCGAFTRPAPLHSDHGHLCDLPPRHDGPHMCGVLDGKWEPCDHEWRDIEPEGDD